MTNEEPVTPWSALDKEFDQIIDNIANLMTSAREIGQVEGRREALHELEYMKPRYEAQTLRAAAEALDDSGMHHARIINVVAWLQQRAEGIEKADSSDHASEQVSGSSSAPQDFSSQPDDAPMRVMRLHFMDRSYLDIEMGRIHDVGGWKFSVINGVESLVIGHGVPRVHYPVANIKSIELGVAG